VAHSSWSSANCPSRRRGKIRIQVEACGICHSDALVKFGAYPGLSFPRIPGHEIAGRVEKSAPNVTEWQKGDRVGVRLARRPLLRLQCVPQGPLHQLRTRAGHRISYDGGYAEYLVVPHESRARIPEKLDAAEAAPLLCAGITTYNALRNSGARSATP